MTPPPGLGRQVGRGLAWGSAGSVVLRFGNVLVGIVLARLLAPEDFGVFAIALAVQGVLVTVVDLGLSADLVRSREPRRLEPTVATISLVLGALLAGAMAATAEPVARALGSDRAAPVIAVLAATLVVSAAGVVPYARLQRGFHQREIFATGLVDLVVGTVVTVLLVRAGWGPMALAVSRLVAQPAATGAQFLLSRTVPRFGYDPALARGAIAYGAPLAGANLLSIALLAVDKVVLARGAGEVALGYYVLAFNVASWPMTVIGQTVRPVALAAFARLDGRAGAGDGDRGADGGVEASDGGLALATRLTWAAAVPVACLLGALSLPVVTLLYGGRWAPAAGALAALAAFGALRVLFDLFATYLIARGATRPVLGVQVAWLVALVPAVVVGARAGGSAGVGWAHVVVAGVVVLPLYLVAVRRSGADLRALARATWLPLLAAAPTVAAAALVARQVGGAFGALVAGGAAGALVYVAVAGRPLLRDLRAARAPVPPVDPSGAPSVAGPVDPSAAPPDAGPVAASGALPVAPPVAPRVGASAARPAPAAARAADPAVRPAPAAARPADPERVP
ncbi:oligosaccharide flippase family protein [Cellulomonas sp.]|uniref:oligosaccharide flippase family protein n=1 Tax=Cellulomonas sp. TaxID=40001 RepID=UPI002D49C6E4|nr:oligosaccharide flippase family protein [Cellulomonas sp.]HYQ74909.1 oligosaccharide flippase family protein [Cellulomonas sp.]